MAFKNVKSTNPVKKAVVTAIKQLHGADKVTSVQEDETSFRANAHKSLGNRNYEVIGRQLVVTKEQLFDMGLLPLQTSAEVATTTTTEEPVSSVEETTTILEENVEGADQESVPQSNSLFG